MKIKFLICGALAWAISATAFADKPLNLSEVPAAVRQTINQQNVEVKQIKREVVDGKTVYQVKTKQKGPEKDIYIREDGSIVSESAKGKGKSNSKGKNKSDRDEVEKQSPATPTPAPVSKPEVSAPKPVVVAPPVSPAPAPTPAPSALFLRDLPLPVQRTVKKALGDDGKVIDIDKQTVGGKTVYQVEYSSGSHRYQMGVAEDGTKVDRVASKVIPLKSLPPAVQATAKKEIGAGEIKDVDKTVINGKTVYQVTFVKGGVRQKVQIAENGTLIK